MMNKAVDKSRVKAILEVGVAICLLISAHRIYKSYLDHRPPYDVGECFSVPPQADSQLRQPLKIYVIENDRMAGITVGTAEIDFMGEKVTVPVRTTFKQIRELNITKVKCD